MRKALIIMLLLMICVLIFREVNIGLIGTVFIFWGLGLAIFVKEFVKLIKRGKKKHSRLEEIKHEEMRSEKHNKLEENDKSTSFQGDEK